MTESVPVPVSDSPPFPDAPTDELRWFTTPSLLGEALAEATREVEARNYLMRCAKHRAELFAELARRRGSEARHG